MTKVTRSKNFPVEIKDLIESCEGDTARELHDDVFEALIEAGYKAKNEYAVQERGDGRKGRVDIVMYWNEELIGIELDRKTARKKSLFKLRNNFSKWAVAVRDF